VETTGRSVQTAGGQLGSADVFLAVLAWGEGHWGTQQKTSHLALSWGGLEGFSRHRPGGAGMISNEKPLNLNN